MPTVGILFDIDELGGVYGLAAYRSLFGALDKVHLRGCSLKDGDTNATLVGRARKYCIAVESYDPSQLAAIVDILSTSTAKGLRPLVDRFLYEERVRHEPLVRAARISARGQLAECHNDWLRAAWDESFGTKAQPPAVTVSGPSSADLQPGLLKGIVSALTGALTRSRKAAPDWDVETTKTVSAAAPAPRPSTSGAERPHDRREYRVGELLGRQYRILDVRRGGMGLVYIVDRLEQGGSRRLVLKTFQHKYLWDANAIRRFEREAMQWIRLGVHPHIVGAVVVEQIEGQPYIWLEFVDGESLADRLARGAIHVSEALDLGLQFVSGMRHAYEGHGLIHRDIKPGNLLLTKDGVLKIADFGLSKLRSELLQGVGAEKDLVGASPAVLDVRFATRSGVRVGTPAYMPPEAILDPSSVDIRSDIYSFGIVAFEMLAGRRVFEGPNLLEQHLQTRPVPPSTLNPAVPAPLDALVLRCLEKAPDRRFASLADLEVALQAVARSLPPRQQPEIRPTPTLPPKAQLFQKAASLMALRRYEEAIGCYQQALDLDPEDAELHNNMGVCLGELGRIHEAAACFEQAVARRPGYAEAWANLGGIYSGLGRYDEGIAACERAITLRPDWAEAHANQGVNLAALGQIDEAAGCFQRAMEVDPKYWKVYLMAAEAYAASGAPPLQLLELLKKALAINPRDADVLASMAACLVDAGRPEDAPQYVTLALEVDPGHPLALRVCQVLTSRAAGKP